ncbi:MAG: RAMP superfamily CRISPR-associated protein [Candidatus Scalindua sp.]|nr:RAMP superfamily CRISPR-associated protein [Candidatus Scalindua sp.]
MGYQLQIYLKSPVCISKNKGVGNVIETVDYVPGNTIRGALAIRYLEIQGRWDQEKRLYALPEENREFNDIFNSDKMCFHNAYIEGKRVVPFTASSCKYQGGFLDSKRDMHGVRDTLIELARYELTGEYDRDRFDICGEICKAPMDRFRGYYAKESEAIYEKGTIFKRFIARTALNEYFETASSGNLYTVEVLNEGQTFIAELNEGLFDRLKPLFDKSIIRIGRSKSRGLGEVEIRVRKTEEDNGHLLVNRFKELNNKMKNLVPGKFFFTLTLLSDAIVLDEILRYKSTIEINDLLDSTQNSPSEAIEVLQKFKLLRGVLSTRIISEWNYALKLPQEDSLSIEKGSVFLFMSESLSDNKIIQLTTILNTIENTGLGERRNKGYGRVRFCDEFHWEDNIK